MCKLQMNTQTVTISIVQNLTSVFFYKKVMVQNICCGNVGTCAAFSFFIVNRQLLRKPHAYLMLRGYVCTYVFTKIYFLHIRTYAHRTSGIILHCLWESATLENYARHFFAFDAVSLLFNKTFWVTFSLIGWLRAWNLHAYSINNSSHYVTEKGNN